MMIVESSFSAWSSDYIAVGSQDEDAGEVTTDKRFDAGYYLQLNNFFVGFVFTQRWELTSLTAYSFALTLCQYRSSRSLRHQI